MERIMYGGITQRHAVPRPPSRRSLCDHACVEESRARARGRGGLKKVAWGWGRVAG